MPAFAFKFVTKTCRVFQKLISQSNCTAFSTRDGGFSCYETLQGIFIQYSSGLLKSNNKTKRCYRCSTCFPSTEISLCASVIRSARGFSYLHVMQDHHPEGKKNNFKITVVVSEVAPILMVPNGKSSWFANRMPFSLQQVCILVLAGLGGGHLVWAFTVTIAPHYLVDWKAPDNLTAPVKPMKCHTCVFVSTDNSGLFSPFCFQGTGPDRANTCQDFKNKIVFKISLN